MRYEMKKAAGNKRLIYADVLRVIATMLVILNHLPSVDLRAFHSGAVIVPDMLLSFLIVTDVPMFFMLSGMLLLDKEESFRDLLKKRIARIAIVLFVVFLGMYITNALVAVKHGGSADISIWGFIKAFLACGLDGAEFYWFLYAYLSLLFMLPFLRPAAKHIGRPEFIMLIVLRVVFSSTPVVINHFSEILLNDTLGVTAQLSFPMAAFDAFFYAICGYYLDKNVDVKKLKAPAFLLLGVLCITAMICSYVCGVKDNYGLFAYVYAFTLFLSVKKALSGKTDSKAAGKDPKAADLKAGPDGSKVAAVFGFLASLCFGIYLLDPFFKRAFYAKYSAVFEPYHTNILFSLGWLCISFTLGAVVSWGLKHIPVVKKFL